MSFLDKSIGYSVNMGALLLKRELIFAFKKNGFDVTPEQWALLSRLSEADNISQNELAQSTFKDNANITRIIDKLIAKKLVEKRDHDFDGRASKVMITKAGRTLVSKLEPLAMEVLEKATKGLSKEDVKKANTTIQKIIKNLQ
jgi:DNA-binding MarR family transcriptional regulator